ncbi:MAG: ABC transporter permease [Chloroflexota bacterium]|nr:ABC transporter permease [Chloroflexota bacterium]
MQAYIARRLLQGVVVVVIVTAAVFLCLNLLPGDPVIARQGTWSGASPEFVTQLRHEMGLDRPIPERYVFWLANAVHGDLGVSYITQEPVGLLISQKLPATLELALTAFLVALLLAVPAAMLAATHLDTWVDWTVTGFVTIGMAVPGFWLGIMLMLLFSVQLRWVPSVGYEPFISNPADNLRHLALPAVTLGLIIAAPIMRFLRSSLLDVMRQEYVTVARAKGLGETAVLLRHQLRNAILPTLTYIGLQFGTLIGGAVIIEWVFSWPGMGWLTVDGVFKRDYSIVQGTVTEIAIAFVVLNLLIDLLYPYLDPRIRYS